ncbi:MAG: hypothetical protein M3Z30_09545 [Gemmatimonadota bacterium]|nr:hypothetical protein [Gemmatimonadota bacterium]
MKLWHGRDSAPLLLIWAIALSLIAILYKIQNVQPGLTELFEPVLAVIFLFALVLTWRWFRGRSSGKRHDRRHRDRRSADRRDDA